MIPALEAYRKIASVYDEAPNPMTSLERRVLGDMLPDLAGLIVIDVGAGTGYWSEYARAAGASVVAIDGCREMLLAGRGDRVQASAQQLPLRDESADVVMCSMMLGYAPEAFAELARVVRPGGDVFVTDLHPERVASGWRRSFRVGTELVEPEHRHYEISDLAHPDLRRSRLIEAEFEAPEHEVFERAGRAYLFDRWKGQAAIFVACWRKVC